MYSSHATTHFDLVRIVPTSYDEYTALVKSGNVASKHVNGWRVRLKQSDLKLSGIWYKRPRIVMRSMSDSVVQLCNRSRQVWEQVWKVMWYVFWWKPGYRDLLSYVTFLLDG